MADKPRVVISKNGPYIVCGGLPIDKQIIGQGKDGDPDCWIQGRKVAVPEKYTLCRCGKSGNKPFCDGTHLDINFDGTETATKKSFNQQAEITEGPALVLKDVFGLCAIARFCHRAGGVWDLTEQSGDPNKRETAIEEACNCPSGRLVAHNKETGQPIEKPFPPSISLTEDPSHKVSGPIWVKGGIPIESSDGTTYEIRNRQTLCRCGKSKNKPFCDGSHISTEFSDDDESLK